MTQTTMRAAALLLIAAAAISGCAKNNEGASADANTEASAAGSAPAAQSPPVTADAPGKSAENSAAKDEKAAAIQAALAEDAIVSDPRGQWAVSATASSTYAGDKAPTAKTSYSAFAATGAPNVERYGDNGHAWTSETADKGIEWLEVQFEKPVSATQIRVRQSYGPGAIIKIELVGEEGKRQTVWQGLDDREYPASTISWFDRTFEKSAFKVNGAKITLATNAVSGWNEIDAVQLLGD